MSIGIYLLAAPAVVALAGLGGALGQSFAGTIGYWLGCYLTAIAAAAIVAAIFARVFGSHPLLWAFGVLGLFVFGHAAWAMLSGLDSGAPSSGSDRVIVAIASLAGLLLGRAGAQWLLARRARPN